MLKDITLGQYFPGNSLLHKLDPRMKLVLTLFFIVLVFLPQNWFGLGLVLVFLAAVVALSRLPLSLLWRSMKPVLFIVLFTAVLNILGWILSAAFLFWIICYALGSKRPGFDAGVSLLFASAIQLAFNAGLGLNLPSGFLGGLL